LSSQFDESLVPEEPASSGQRLDDAGSSGGSPTESPDSGRDTSTIRRTTGTSAEPRPIDDSDGEARDSGGPDPDEQREQRGDRKPAGPEGPADPPIVVPESDQKGG
jgi:hypothetical protein